ncbi:hypothetical protein HYS54_04090 [Candidatus Micrarchaeota archaeon]|nr:hypothetical protein [Candidatus Micrarchaeota archaeon]
MLLLMVVLAVGTNFGLGLSWKSVSLLFEKLHRALPYWGPLVAVCALRGKTSPTLSAVTNQLSLAALFTLFMLYAGYLTVHLLAGSLFGVQLDSSESSSQRWLLIICACTLALAILGNVATLFLAAKFFFTPS